MKKTEKLKINLLAMLDSRFPNKSHINHLRMRFTLKAVCEDMLLDAERNTLKFDFKYAFDELRGSKSIAEMTEIWLEYKSQLVGAMVEKLNNN
jgi:predicted TIM-barrel fold metal-dependent hydrolase